MKWISLLFGASMPLIIITLGGGFATISVTYKLESQYYMSGAFGMTALIVLCFVFAGLMWG